MPLAAQLAKLLTKGAQKAMSPVMKHEPTMRVLTPEQEAASFAPIGPSSYRLLPEEQAPITSVETPIAEMEELVPPAESNKPRIRRQVEDLGLSEKEVDELLIPEPIDISNMPEAWKAPYMKARDQEFTVPLYHFTRAGEEIQIDPRGEGTGFLDPLLLKKAGNDTRDIGTHLGTLSAMGKMNKRLGKKKRKIMGVTLGQKQGEEQLGQAMLPVVTKLNNVAIVPDMGRFKLPSEWLENLSNLNIEIRPTKTIKHLLRKDNLEKDFKGNIDTIKSTLDSSIETVNDLKRYVKEKGDFIFWPEDGNFIYLKNEEKLSTLDNFGVKLSKTKASKFIDFSKSFDPLKGMSPTLWKQLMEAAHALHMKNIKLTTKKMDPDAGVFIPENIHPSLIDDWYKALRKILEEGGYDAFAYPNFTEDYGAFSYMFLDPKKVKSIFAREFDKENVSFGKNEGGVVDMRNGGKVGAAVVAASLMASGGQATLDDFTTPSQFAERQKKIDQRTEVAKKAGFKNFSEYYKSDYTKRLGKARDANTSYWKKYGPMGNFQSKQKEGGLKETEFMLPPGYNLSDETITEQNKLIENAYKLRNQKLKDDNESEGYSSINKKYLDNLKAKEDEEYERTGKRTGQVSLTQLNRDSEKQKAQIAQDSVVAFSKGGVVDMRDGGVVGMKKGGWLEKATDYTGKVAEQMDSLLEKKYEKHLSDVAEAKQNAKKIGRNVTEPVPIPTMDVSKTTDVPIPTMDTTDELPPVSEMMTGVYESRSIMSGLIGEVEGETWERDTVRNKKYPKGILTSPYGINTRDHAKLLEELKIQNNVTTIKGIPKKELKEAALNIFSRMGNEYAAGNKGVTPSEWNTLSGKGQFVVTSATFNAGDSFPLLTRALIKYESDPTLVNLSAAVKETWRKGGKGAQKGADNRAVKDLIAGGFIDLSNPDHKNILRNHLKEHSLKSK